MTSTNRDGQETLIDSGEEIRPEAALSQFGDPTNAAIVHALAESWKDAGFELDYGLTAAELREQVSVGDEAEFAEHLDRLSEHFVRKTDSGYEFRYLGWVLAKLVITGPLVDRTAVAPFTFESTCHLCGSEQLEAYYVNDWLWIDCPACDSNVNTIEKPPVRTDGMTVEEVMKQGDRRQRRRELNMVEGICPDCYGDMPVAVETFSWGDHSFTRFMYRCADCDRKYVPPLGWDLIDHPAVVEFYEHHDVDLDRVYHWEIGPLASDQYETILSEDPWVFEGRFPCGDDAIELTMDEEKAVVGIRW